MSNQTKQARLAARQHLGHAPSAVNLMKLSPAERSRILARAAAVAEDEYRTDSSLTDFEAFDEDDLFDATPEE